MDAISDDRRKQDKQDKYGAGPSKGSSSGGGKHEGKDAQLLLTVHGDGTASGSVVGSCAFMRLRDQRLPFGYIDDFVHDEGHGHVSYTSVNLAATRTLAAGLAIGTQVPDVHATVGGDDDEWTLWLFHHAS